MGRPTVQSDRKQRTSQKSSLSQKTRVNYDSDTTFLWNARFNIPKDSHLPTSGLAQITPPQLSPKDWYRYSGRALGARTLRACNPRLFRYNRRKHDPHSESIQGADLDRRGFVLQYMPAGPACRIRQVRTGYKGTYEMSDSENQNRQRKTPTETSIRRNENVSGVRSTAWCFFNWFLNARTQSPLPLSLSLQFFGNRWKNGYFMQNIVAEFLDLNFDYVSNVFIGFFNWPASPRTHQASLPSTFAFCWSHKSWALVIGFSSSVPYTCCSQSFNIWRSGLTCGWRAWFWRCGMRARVISDLVWYPGLPDAKPQMALSNP